MVQPLPNIVSIIPTEAIKMKYPNLRFSDQCYVYEKTYVIGVNKIDGFTHIKIMHIHNWPVEDWYSFQEIKNFILGENAQAVQVYPRESDLVDGSNTYHLWSWDGIEKVLPNLKKMPRYH